MGQSSLCSCVFALFLNTFSTASSVDVVFLDTFRHLYLSRITEDLYKGQVRSGLYFLSISLSTPLSSHLLNHSLSLQTTFQVIFKLFQAFFFTWYVLNLSFSCIFMFWNLGFGVFKIDEFLLKFGMGFSLHEFKISYIAFHVHYNSIIMHLVVCYIC